MQGTFSHGGHIVTVSWDMNYERLLSPDGKQHLLPCEKCKTPKWQELNVVSYLCMPCVTRQESEANQISIDITVERAQAEVTRRACIVCGEPPFGSEYCCGHSQGGTR